MQVHARQPSTILAEQLGVGDALDVTLSGGVDDSRAPAARPN